MVWNSFSTFLNDLGRVEDWCRGWVGFPSLDRAGRVLKVQGTLAGTTTEYAKAVTYNASSQMSSLTFGNNLIV